jgi:hypothetical protein
MTAVLNRYDYEVLPRTGLYEWQRRSNARPPRSGPGQAQLPDGAKDYLRWDNARLVQLQQAYSRFDQAVTRPLVWTDDLVRRDDLTAFRGDNAYVWQRRGQNMNPLGYILTTYYVKSLDNLHLLERLAEDEFFGVATFLVADKVVSRDLLDSIIELSFLEKHLGVSKRENLSILDVGAGYGRLAHRAVAALPNVRSYFCTDAVPVSTFLSEYYLRFRRVDERAQVVPLHEIESALANHAVDLAINIHSFSECTLSAIEWWFRLLAQSGIKHVMIAPNPLDHGGELLLTNHHEDFSHIAERHGYRLIAKEPKYRDACVQDFGIMPTYYHLLELS